MYTVYMSRGKVVIVFFVLIGFLALIYFSFSAGEDIWVCKNGEWKKDGRPAYPKPKTNCEGTKIVVISPQPYEVVKNPLAIKGMARGFWFFEAVFPVCLYDNNTAKLGCGIMQAKDNWMTTDFVPFEGKIDFELAKYENGTLILEKSNPSGLKENAEQIEIPVRFGAGSITAPETIKIKIYFNNSKLDPFSCEEVFAAEREIIKTPAVARRAIEELLKGPTEKEKEEGFLTNINPDVKIQKLNIKNGLAEVDFDKQMEFQVAGSCRVLAIRSQIIQTLKQFPTVKDVVISIDGRIEDILQP